MRFYLLFCLLILNRPENVIVIYHFLVKILPTMQVIYEYLAFFLPDAKSTLSLKWTNVYSWGHQKLEYCLTDISYCAFESLPLQLADIVLVVVAWKLHNKRMSWTWRLPFVFFCLYIILFFCAFLWRTVVC